MVLYPVIRQLQHKRVVLASASPRRREILSTAGLRFEVVPSRFKEKLDKTAFPAPWAYAVETAKQKALDVARRMHQKDLRAPDIVIGADTIVTLEGQILEKPVDKQDAYRMLSRLNGKEHSVFTGVTIIQCSCQDGRLDLQVSEFYEETLVRFSQLSEELLWEYIHSGEPMDKAGGYGIQALGGMLVEQVKGDFLNVVGFPLNHFCKKLAELGPAPPRPQDAPPAPPARAEGNGDRPRAAGRRDSGHTRLVDGPPPTPLLEIIDGFRASKALFTACKMKVFDVLQADAPLGAPEVARRIAASEEGTERLLDACAALGLLEKTEGGYSNSALASLYLPADSEASLQPLVLYSDRHAWDFFSRLEDAVRQGPAQDRDQDQDQNQDRDQNRDQNQDRDQDRDREQMLQCLGAAHSLARLTARSVATAFDLSRFGSACDLGGGTGALARELARTYPGLSVTVFDLPEVLEAAAAFQPGPTPDPAPRVRFVPGDVFRDALPAAELYVLSRGLRLWPDRRAHALLARLSRRCPPGAALLVAEAAPDGPGGALRALDLLAGRGRARGLGALGRLLRAHGFEPEGAARTGAGTDVLLALRAPSPP